MFADTNPLLAGDSGSAAASARWQIEVLNADAGYRTASGHDYASAVPEASSGATLLAGLAVLAWLGRTRRRD